MTQERIWQGNSFHRTRVLVLGESWYGKFEGDLVTDAGWIQAYLEGRVKDRMYSKMANACGMPREEYWHGVAYTNFVQCVGAVPSARPTSQQYVDATPRLRRLLSELTPRGVWVLGEEQSRYSKPVIEEAGLICEVAWHPTRIGVTNEMLGASWSQLQRKLGVRSEGLTADRPVPNNDQNVTGLASNATSRNAGTMNLVVSNLMEPLAVKKYKFPRTAPVYELTINGKRCQAANTQGGSPLRKYTYFIWEGVSYYVPGHISPLATASLKASPWWSKDDAQPIVPEA